ncbi:2-nitropropane dioxygenase [Pseudonocardia sp. EC080610-09]|uniref:NAD(P)H-dependent flavin oxidoreductase n=1 Tax=unclassified Pseudonocardia TaxID=2619320 RepID=UPI0006CB01A6|nr:MULTISPECIES: nitronate monooxygenase [unclassified Pseudonocardia]ALE75007.1 2-nitropropane dioxygenase [Pseudonocardia sp. EC080625-04]ALL74355.1 2-nitropropane dioxygenase [Pseudonocardia sp. EC080610-09]ALL81379.1 2-nitropropane dioxygenase [Pseudonocardia sp. EC080619-01]
MDARVRTTDFCTRYGLRAPVLEAPMAGACPPELAAAVAAAGGMGAAGVVNDPPERIAAWARRFRELAGDAPFQLNLWIPDPPVEAATGPADAFLAGFGGRPAPPPGPGPDVDAQFGAVLEARPTAVSTIMGLLRPDQVAAAHDAGIAWFATATTRDDALAAERAGADVVVAQAMEAGGHRGTTDPADAESTVVGLFALVPWLADALTVPVVAAGAVADGRSLAAALTLGASAAQVGTALLRTPEAGIDDGWAATFDGLAPEATVTTRAYTGRLARAVPTDFVRAWARPDAPAPAPYPHQRRMVARYRAGEPGRVDRANHWAGQAAARSTTDPAGDVVERMWREADALLP